MKEILILASVSLLIGCGGGGGTSVVSVTEDPLPSGTEAMVAGEIYAVTTGDRVVKISEDTQIKVTHIYDEINSTIELIEGEANIVRSQ
ncbi:MAG: hypothetical protein U9R26_06165 [Campylobacterota bacterium]|nr:hypothetical protein [Campylobacterota bacterium]